jgi:hypothetical protein
MWKKLCAPCGLSNISCDKGQPIVCYDNRLFYMTGPTEQVLCRSMWRYRQSQPLSLFPLSPTLEHRASVKRFFPLQFLNPKTAGRTPWTGDQPIARPLPTQTRNNRTHTSMPWVRFEPTIPAPKPLIFPYVGSDMDRLYLTGLAD